jgi:hypothetical protein
VHAPYGDDAPINRNRNIYICMSDKLYTSLVLYDLCGEMENLNFEVMTSARPKCLRLSRSAELAIWGLIMLIGILNATQLVGIGVGNVEPAHRTT